MADTKISALTALTGANIATTDEVVLVDTSAGETKKADVVELGKSSSFPLAFVVACSDETTAITATGEKVEFRMPFAFTVTEVRADLRTACTTGTFTVDINESGTSILSTKLTLDATEKTSQTAATPAVISDSALADNAEIQIDVDNVGDSTGKGLKVTIIGYRA